MTELVKKLVSEANITEEMAEKVISVVAGFAEEKLPEPISCQVVNFLNNQDATDVKDTLNNLLSGFGKTK